MRFTALLLTLASLFGSTYAQATPANVVCYQTIVGSSASYADVSASLDAWSQEMYSTLGLSGPIELQVGHAQVPDRDSFENGCNGPYNTVADLFVHIQATAATYDAISDSLEAFIASHPVTSLSTISCAARSVVDELPSCGKLPPTGNNPTQPDESTPDNVVCYQEIVGSLTGTYAQVSAALDAWELKMYNTLGLTGPIELQVGHAQVPDRDSFENGCNGPYATVADIFVHIQATAANYDTLSAALEAFIAANPLTSSSPISCSARSVVTFLPRCGKNAPAPAVTQPPVVTEAPATTAPTTPTGTNPTQQPESPTPADVVCYQEVVGSSTGTYAQLSAALDAWSQKMYNTLGLTGDIELSVGHAQVTDRDSFENGCNGPYTAVADLFVHIQTTNANYDAVSAALEAFIAANPLTNSEFAPISCSARSVVTYLPTCGKVPTPTTPVGNNPTQAPEVPTPANVVCYQEVVGSLTGTYAQVSADLDDWQQKMYVALGLTGPIELQVGHAQIPDRVSFENGCNGPYATMADLFVHIQTTQANYDAVSAALEAFIAANPLTAYASIDCSARSVVTYLPTCGKTEGTPTGVAPPQQDDNAQLCYQEVVGSLTGTYAQVSAALDAWQLKMYTELGLTGPIELTVGHAQIPDRVSFENGCNGPYATMADLFVHIPTTFGAYDELSARLEAFIAANPLTSLSPISCSARSVVSELPSCGKVPNPPVSTPTGANQPQPGSPARSCPVTTYTSSITDSGASATAGKRLYTISYDMANGDADIQFIDVHITTASGFYNARMSLSASASPAQPSYEFVFPEYLALGQGESVSWWFTTAINIPELPNIWACDSASTSFTTPGAPAANPTSPPAATGPCPAIAFNNAIVRTGNGETSGTGAYAITFANASPDRTVEWVDVHLTANGGQFNYRMDLSPDATPTSVSFITNLPSPYLNLAPGAQVSYWFTYESQGTACDSSTFTFTATTPTV